MTTPAGATSPDSSNGAGSTAGTDPVGGAGSASDAGGTGSAGVAVERIDPAPDRFAALATRALPYDAAEVPALLARLAHPPAGRRTAWLRAGDAGVALLSVNDTDDTVGHLDLLAVDPRHRRAGAGTALVGAAEELLRCWGVRQVRWAGNPPCYGWPGVDVRYTPAVCLAQRLGYERYQAAHNMTARLADADLSTEDEERRLADAGVRVRRADVAELPALRDWARRVWNSSWAWELEQSVLGRQAGCHVAWRGGQVLAFAGYGANRPGWFGPMGTDPDARGLGLGRVLLRRCLADQRDAGLTTADIGWVGPIPFYSRTVGAHVDRVFWLYRKQL